MTPFQQILGQCSERVQLPFGYLLKNEIPSFAFILK
jgi:hypothetical protein